jgi:hypothetical protein
MEPIFLIVLLSIFLGVTATAQESLLEKREKVKQEKMFERQKHAEEQDKLRKAHIEAIEERKRKTLLERAKKV